MSGDLVLPNAADKKVVSGLLRRGQPESADKASV